jgi:hypothetical protein
LTFNTLSRDYNSTLNLLNNKKLKYICKNLYKSIISYIAKPNLKCYNCSVKKSKECLFMVYSADRKSVSGLKIAYIGGGSRGWAWGLMSDLAVDTAIGGEVYLYDIDMNAARVNEIIGNKINSHPDANGKWKYVAVPTLKEALSGADFVVISILPGTFDEMEVEYQ